VLVIAFFALVIAGGSGGIPADFHRDRKSTAASFLATVSSKSEKMNDNGDEKVMLITKCNALEAKGVEKFTENMEKSDRRT